MEAKLKQKSKSDDIQFQLIQAIIKRKTQIDKMDSSDYGTSYAVDTEQVAAPVSKVHENTNRQKSMAIMTPSLPGSLLWDTQTQKYVGIDENTMDAIQIMTEGNTSKGELEREGVIIGTDSMLARLKQADVAGERTFDMSDDTFLSSLKGSLIQKGMFKDSILQKMPKTQDGNKTSPTNDFIQERGSIKISPLRFANQTGSKGRDDDDSLRKTPGRDNEDVNMSAELGKNKRDGPEISVIGKTGQGSFMDSFLLDAKLFEAMKSQTNSQRRALENDEDLLADDPINELFKEIEQVEFDMENTMDFDKYLPGDSSVEETIRRSLGQSEMRVPLNPGPPTGRYQIETICEHDEEEHSDEEVVETRKTQFSIRQSNVHDIHDYLAQIEEETSQDQFSTEEKQRLTSSPSKNGSKFGSKPSNKTLLVTSDMQDQDDRRSDDTINVEQERQRLEQETEALKQKLMEQEQEQQDIILTKRNSYHSDQFHVSQEQSYDSLDQLWQKALGKNESIDEEGSIEEQVIPPEVNEDAMQFVAASEMNFHEEEEEVLDEKLIEEIRLQTMLQHNKEINSLISFIFPSSDEKNQQNINLKDYHKYFVHQMHLAPSTDQRMAFMTLQAGFGLTDAAGEELGLEYYQELGCIGFYGITSNSEIMISMLLLTNCHDVREAFNLSKAKTAFNNPQQYLVPDIQVSQLRNSLKKIIKHLMKVKKYKRPVVKQSPQKQQTQTQTNQINNLLENKSEDLETKHLKNFLLEHADFGLVLLLGKLYFHLSKFRQSIFSLNLSVEKCKRAKTINQSNLSECLLWKIFVSKIYLVNKIRVLKQYQITKIEQRTEQQNKIQEIRHKASFMKFVEVPLTVANPTLFFDKTEISLSQEIVDLYKDTLKCISEFMEIPKKEQKNTEVILYIQLKLEIFRQSPLYRKIIRMHAGIDHTTEMDKGMITNLGTARNSILGGANRFTGAAQKTQSFFKKLQSLDFSNQTSRTQSLQYSEVQSQQANEAPKKRLSTYQKIRNQLKGNSNPLTPSNKKISGNLLGSMMESQYAPNPDSKRNSQENFHQFSELPGTQPNLLTCDNNERLSFLNEQEEMFQEEILDKNTLFQKLLKIVQQIYPFDQYIGCVAQSEVHFWKMRNDYELDYTDLEVSVATENKLDDFRSPSLQSRQRLSSVAPSMFKVNEEMTQGIKVLTELIDQCPKRLLGSVKLWQFFKTMATFSRNDFSNMSNSLDVAEEIQRAFDKPQKQSKHFPSNNLSKKPSKDLVGNTEARLIITLINARSLFDLRDYALCFDNLQFEFLKNSKYTCLLYLYGKYIIKANCREETPQAGKVTRKEVRYEQISYIGSGIGAMEECLKSSLPEYQSRGNYYIGLAYNDKNCRFQMPMQSIHYWVSAYQVNFQTPYQGVAKLRKIKKFLDEFQFFHNILDIIDKSMLDQSSPGFQQADRDELKRRAESFLQVLTSFQEKVDGPSSLLLKSYIYAFTLKNDEQAQRCYRELLFKFPEFIKGYIEYWRYLNLRYKVQKQIANKLFKEAKQQQEESYIKAVMQQAFDAKEKASKTRKELRSVIHMALTQSNHCVQTSTVEWVNVRILAAKTYIIEKKFNKAIHVLTDLCYVIPPDMLQINADHANIAAYYQLEGQQNMGGITFCKRILQEADCLDDQSLFDKNEQDEEPEGMDSAFHREFHNRIFIDQIQENEMLKDFQEATLQNDLGSFIRHSDSILKEDAEILFKDESPQRPIITDEQQEFDLPLRQRDTVVSKWDMAQFEAANNSQRHLNSNFKIMENLRQEEFIPQIQFNLDEESDATLRKKSVDQPTKTMQHLNPQNIVPPLKLALSQALGSASIPEGARLHNDRMSEVSSNKFKPKTARIGESNELSKPKGLREQLQEKLNKQKSYTRRRGSFTSSGDSRASIVSRACTMKGSARMSYAPGSRNRMKEKDTNLLGNPLSIVVRKRESAQEDQDNLLYGKAFAEEPATDQKSTINRRMNSIQTSKYSVFDVQEFQEMLRHPLAKQLTPEQQRTSVMTVNQHICDQNTSKLQFSIFAVNSDVSFLYMIGKICCQAGHNLKLGLQALNDYYLFMWHYSESQYNLRENESLSLKQIRNPLNHSGEPCTPITRIKECIKALLCIGQIYMQLNEPDIAKKYFLKILEDRETLCKSFECKKQVLLAEEELGKILKRLVVHEGQEPDDGLGSATPILIVEQHF